MERELLQETLPFSPYGLRLRPLSRASANAIGGDDRFVALVRPSLCLSEVCPDWDAVLPQPLETLRIWRSAARADARHAYKGCLFSGSRGTAVFTDEVKIDDLLGHFSHRYETKSVFSFS